MKDGGGGGGGGGFKTDPTPPPPPPPQVKLTPLTEITTRKNPSFIRDKACLRISKHYKGISIHIETIFRTLPWPGQF